MNQETSKSHYEMLQISPEATADEIEEAYTRLRALYGKESVAFYSLFSEEERESMMERVDAAYSALIDPVKRRSHDAELAASGERQVPKDSGIVELKGEEIISNRFKLKAPLIVSDDRDPIAAEQYRVLYTKLEEISRRDSFKCFAVTSALKGEGKTTTSMNLAYLMAKEFKKRVVLIECDLKNPSLSKFFMGGGTRSGLIDVLSGRSTLNEATAQVEQSTLYVLPAGGKIMNSSELLSLPQMRRTLSALKEKYDYLIVDSPPVLPLADLHIISKIVDGLIFVVRAGKTPKDLVVKAAKSITTGEIMGIVLNGAENSLKNYYY